MESPPATSESQSNSFVTIRDFYKDFVPPRYVRPLTFRLLSSVPAKYLYGLDCVVLSNQSGAPRRRRVGKTTSRGRRFPQNQVLGHYYREHSGKPAWIELYVDNITRAISYAPLIPLARTALFAKVLFHEVGHHIHATIRPEFREKEDVADNWSKELTRRYLRSRYWYVPGFCWKVFGHLLKALAAEI